MRPGIESAMCRVMVMSLTLAGCGKGHGGGDGATTGPTANAPAVSSFQIPAAHPRGERPVGGVPHQRDRGRPGRDAAGGRAEVRVVTTGQVTGKAIEPSDLRGSAFSVVLFFESPPPGRLDLSFSIVDAGGHRSNEIPFAVTFAAAETPHGAAPGGGGTGLRSVR